MLRKACLSVLCVVSLACGPSAGGNIDGGGGGGLPDAYAGPAGTVTGRVWAPGNAPGMVPAGHEIPISGALVWLSLAPPPAIPQQTYCDTCVNTPGGAVFTDAAGNFTLTNIRPETYWIMIQKGQFRIDQQITVVAEQNTALTVAQTTLPSVHDEANGKWTPKMAMVTGTWDRMEDVLGKMKIGDVDSSGEFQGNSMPSHLDLYSGDGGPTGLPPPFGSAIPYDYQGRMVENLFANINTMLQYHVILIPCGSDFDGIGPDQYGLLNDPAVRQRIVDYVNAGGKLYVTDWSSEWEDGMFPEFIVFDDGVYDTVSSNDIKHGNGGSSAYTSSAKADDPGLNAWLDLQSGPDVNGNAGPYDANNFEVEGNWNKIMSTPSILIGQDNKGFDVFEEAHAWVLGDWGNGGGPTKALTVTFEPTGCGRIMYSTYHTVDGVHPGLAPQERVLLYLLMEIGECHSGPIVE